MNSWGSSGFLWFGIVLFAALLVYLYGNSRYEQGKTNERLAQALAVQAAKAESDEQLAFVRAEYSKLKESIIEAPNDISCLHIVGNVIDGLPAPRSGK